MLIILDGFGVNPSRPHNVFQASGEAVGLPDGQFDNSEVGHLTLGAGRVLKQDLPRISQAISSDELSKNANWKTMLGHSSRLHLVGLVSDGGVHSHIDHLCGLLPLIAQAGVIPVIHMVSDGRDTPPRSAASYLPKLTRHN